MNKEQIRPFALGAIAGAIVLSIAMFSTGWAVTGNTAEVKARAMSYASVAEALAKICVAQFEVSTDKNEKLTKLIATDTWQRGTYVSDQGWATMPGSNSADSQVARACATRLAKLQD